MVDCRSLLGLVATNYVTSLFFVIGVLGLAPWAELAGTAFEILGDILTNDWQTGEEKGRTGCRITLTMDSSPHIKKHKNIFRFLYYLKREPLGDFLLGLSLGPYLEDHLT